MLGKTIVLLCVLSAVSHAEPARYLTLDIVKNYAERMYGAGEGLETLEQSEDAEARRRYAEYSETLKEYSYKISFLRVWMDADFAINLEEEVYALDKVYRKALLMRVPPEVKAVYAEHGLGEQGHQVILCFFAGLQIAVLERNLSQAGERSARAQKVLLHLSSLIHPKDMELIEILIHDMERMYERYEP
jgi:hypothetical protein